MCFPPFAAMAKAIGGMGSAKIVSAVWSGHGMVRIDEPRNLVANTDSS